MANLINNENVLAQGLTYNPQQVGTQKVSALGYVQQPENAIGALAKTGIFIADEISKQNRKNAEAEYNQAMKNKDKLLKENQDIVYNQAKDFINVNLTKFQNQLTGNDYLDEYSLQNKREKWFNDIRGTISNDRILTAEQKESLKLFLGNKNNSLNRDITTNGYKARFEKTVTDTLNQREDNKVAIGLAIQNGNMEHANEIIVRDRKYRKILSNLDPNKYNKEWENNQGSDLTIYAGNMVISKAFNDYQKEYLENPTDENYEIFKKKVFDTQNQFVSPDFLRANFGSSHGLETPVFEKNIKILAKKALDEGYRLGGAKQRKTQEDKLKNAFDWKNNALSSYAVENGVKRVDPDAFKPSGNLLSTAYIRMNEDVLQKKGLIGEINSNDDLMKVLHDNPDLPKPEFNVLGESGVKAITNLYDTGDYVQLSNMLDTQYGKYRTPEVDQLINNELMETTGGKITLDKIRALSTMPLTTEQKDYAEAMNITKNMENLGISRDRIKKLSTKDMLGNNSGFFKEPTIPFKDIDTLRTLSLTDKNASRIVNQIDDDTKSVATVLVYENMTEAERRNFIEATTTNDQARQITKFLEEKPELQTKVRKYYDSMLQHYMGDDRPFRVNGYSFLANKNNYDENYIQEEFNKAIDNKLYFERGGEDVRIGNNNASTSTRIEPDENGELSLTLNGQKVYTIKNGQKEYIKIPAKPKDYEYTSYMDKAKGDNLLKNYFEDEDELNKFLLGI